MLLVTYVTISSPFSCPWDLRPIDDSPEDPKA
uniref:Uncharacterized protein n=1 Tax=Arundo donax TaxID=35708 RepID=A0A0A9H2Y9_ARUDO